MIPNTLSFLPFSAGPEALNEQEQQVVQDCLRMPAMIKYLRLLSVTVANDLLTLPLHSSAEELKTDHTYVSGKLATLQTLLQAGQSLDQP